jgi:hypothetical protein
MPEDVAIDISAPDASVDTAPVDTGADIDITAPDAGAEPEAPDTDADAKPGRVVVDGRLSPAHKAALDAIAADPKNKGIADALRRDAFFADRMRRELPGGVQELQQLRERIETLGGPEGIEEVQSELNGWHEFDQQFTAGDPKVLEFLTQTPEGMQSFLKIVPMAMEKYREAHPDGFNSYVTQIFTADMNQAQIPLIVARLADYLGQVPEGVREQAMGLWKHLNDYTNRIAQLASKQVTPPKIEAPPKPDNSLQERELNFTRKEWRAEAEQQHHNKIFNAAWQKHVGARQITPEQQRGIIRLYRTELQELLTAKKDWNPTLERYVKSGQKDGFLRHFGAVYQEASPLALRRALAAFGITKTAPKPAANGTQPGAAKPTATAPKAAAGFVLVGKKPDMATEVNRGATTPEMWTRRQAILKDGRRVTWR